jgi:hypothetical protein
MRMGKVHDNCGKDTHFQRNSLGILDGRSLICRVFALLGLSTNERRMLGRIDSDESAANLPISRTSRAAPWRLPPDGGF